jgi:hypothetical protein
MLTCKNKTLLVESSESLCLYSQKGLSHIKVLMGRILD